MSLTGRDRVELRWLDEILGVDWINTILTQALVKESPHRNILNFDDIGIKITRTVIMEAEFVN